MASSTPNPSVIQMRNPWSVYANRAMPEQIAAAYQNTHDIMAMLNGVAPVTPPGIAGAGGIQELLFLMVDV